MIHRKSLDDVSIFEEIERLRQAKRVLEEMDEHKRVKHFNMSTWLTETTCGTVGCLAGFCSIDAWFVERGFTGKFIPTMSGSEWDFGIEPDQFFPRTSILFYSGGNYQRVLLRTTKLIDLLEKDKDVEYVESWCPFITHAFGKWDEEYFASKEQT